ncbi:hypothetical protein HYALB_00007344 [Hymenoscyphus albidus]|uniref:MOSC domain-containing protein n=1 Tax=Hymenoscyphus albidus TaxID=595503 RepID=A0A9N9LGJ8_9HELO|nr:hypothetical protein HYALB_00007344 [Hymenoscyphus albidus]
MITDILIPSQNGGFLLGALAIFLSSLSYLVLSKSSHLSRKANRAKAMKDTFISISQQSKEIPNTEATLYIHPIKSLRSLPVSSALLTPTGFAHDRTFMLLHKQPSGELKNMHIANYPSMSLFHPSLSPEATKLVIEHRKPGSLTPSGPNLELDLEPSCSELEEVKVDMHSSPTTGYKMGREANDWFSARFGFPVILTYWGGNPRAVLGSLPGRPSNEGSKPPSVLSKLLSHIPILEDYLKRDTNEKIAFNDCFPYLVISLPSFNNVSSRLPSGASMDITKFRSNIVVSTSLPAWDEDLWGSIQFPSCGTEIILTSNCGRCKSLNVDYRTGEHGKTDDVKVYHRLQKDRRVDQGVKYSPVFGRYGFLGKGGEGVVLRVGDEVRVGERLERTTRFYWPGITN